jgi:hypothetical protein
MRHTIILTSILLGMSGAIALASPDGANRDHSVIAQTKH